MLRGIINSIGAAVTGAGGTGTLYIDKDADNYGIGEDLTFFSTAADNIAIGENALNSTTGVATFNIGIGTNALTALTLGDGNTAVGYEALKANEEGGNNTAIGKNAMVAANEENFDNNIAVGVNALGGAGAIALDACVVIGNDAVQSASLTAGADGTVAVGYSALKALTSGGKNIAIGYEAGQAIGSDIGNTLVGYEAGKALTGGNAHYNTAIGGSALTSASVASIRNTAIGYTAMAGLVGDTVTDCVAVGYSALVSARVSGATGTVAIGSNALFALTSGANNIAIGYQSMLTHTIGERNIAIGYGAMDDTDDTFEDTTQSSAIAIATPQVITMDGANANILVGMSVTAATEVIPVGTKVSVVASSSADPQVFTIDTALTAELVGSTVLTFSGSNASDDNIFIGHDSGGGTWVAEGITENNVAIGNSTMDSNLDGANKNTCVGNLALSTVTTADGNTAVGYQAGYSLSTGGTNTAVGAYALDGNLGSTGNTAIGYQTITGDAGSNNTAVGYQAGTAIASNGVDNTCVGNQAGNGIADGTQNICIGSTSETGDADSTNQTAIGYGCTAVDTDDSVTLGNADVTDVYMAEDKGAKVHCGHLEMGTTGAGNAGIHITDSFVYYSYLAGTSSQVHLVFNNANGDVGSIDSSGSNTSYGTTSDYRLKENEVTLSDGLTRLNKLKPYRFNFKADKDETLDGFFAHEVAEVVPQAITGEKDGVDSDGNMITQHIDHSKIVPLLVKAVQELSAQVEELKNK